MDHSIKKTDVQKTEMMPTTNDPIINTLKKVATGKKGSRSLTPSETQELIRLLGREHSKGDQQSSIRFFPEQIGACLAAFRIKGVEPQEKPVIDALGGEGVLQEFERLIPILGKTPQKLVPLFKRLWTLKTLTRAQAKAIGLVLFDTNGLAAGWKGWVMTLMRMRYETFEEFMGFLDALHDVSVKGYQTPLNHSLQLNRIQISEPFDGFNRSYMVSPVVMADFNRFGYEMIALTGEQPGPKDGMTLEQNLTHLNTPIWPPYHQDRSMDWFEQSSSFGWRLPQNRWWPASQEWVSIRRHIAKRPCLATLERLPNLTGAGTLITSAFHPPYGEKMLCLGLAEGYRRVIVIQNGLEGGITASITRPTRVLCAVQNNTGVVWTQITIPPPVLPDSITTDRLNAIDIHTNIDRCRRHLITGRSGDDLFDAVVFQTRRIWRCALIATKKLEYGRCLSEAWDLEEQVSFSNINRNWPNFAQKEDETGPFESDPSPNGLQENQGE